MRPLFLLLVLLSSSFAVPAAAVAGSDVVVYKSASCGHCGPYLEALRALLVDAGFRVVEKDIVQDRAALRELDGLTRERGIPLELQGHMVAVLDGTVLEGHVPLEVVEGLLASYQDGGFPGVVVFQDSMDVFVTEYTVWVPGGGRVGCSTEESFAACVERAGQGGRFGGRSFAGLVVVNGLLAGVHPCTVSVLLFFLALLFTMRKSRRRIVEVGVAYIVGIFVAYMGIGLGLLKAVSLGGSPHVAAKVGAVLILLLGVVNLVGFFSKRRWSFGIPRLVKPGVVALLERATVPAVFLVGLVVGICSFGCTAGIYLSVISLLLAKSAFAKGVAYLLLYNVMFVLPLVVVLVFASTKRVVERLERWEVVERRWVRLVSGVVMVVLALVILWLTGGL